MAKRPSGGAAPRRIDVHHHIYPPNYTKANIDWIVNDARNKPAREYLSWRPSRSLEDMDKNGVETSLASITSPGIWTGNRRLSRKWARDVNEYGAQLAIDYPGRFGMMAALPLPDVEGSLAEIEHAFDVLGVDGIGLMTNYGSKLLGDPLFAPIMRELNRRKAKVFVHPTSQPCCQEINPYVNAPLMEFPFDTTRTIISLAYSGTLNRCPNIRFIFCHGGGTLPFLAGRIAGMIRQNLTPAKAKQWFPRGLIHELAKQHYDIVSVTERPAMEAVRAIIPTEKLLLGSDLPFRNMGMTLGPMEKLGFTKRERKMIERDNALKLFPRFKTAPAKAAR